MTASSPKVNGGPSIASSISPPWAEVTTTPATLGRPGTAAALTTGEDLLALVVAAHPALTRQMVQGVRVQAGERLASRQCPEHGLVRHGRCLSISPV